MLGVRQPLEIAWSLPRHQGLTHYGLYDTVLARERKDGARVGEWALGGRSVALDGLEVVEGAVDRLFESHRALVLRPDRYIFGVVDEAWTLDQLLIALARKLALN